MGVCAPSGAGGSSGGGEELQKRAEMQKQFRSLRLVCWVPLPSHPTHNSVFLDSAGTWDPAAKFRLSMEICEIMSRYFMSFLQINSREIIGI